MHTYLLLCYGPSKVNHPYLDDEPCSVVTAICLRCVCDEEQSAFAIDWSQFSTGGRHSDARIRGMGQVGSKWKWVPIEDVELTLITSYCSGIMCQRSEKLLLIASLEMS